MKLNYYIENYIGKIELFNPPYNTLLSPVFENYNTLKKFLNNKELKAVIITGSGRNFCAGADLEKLKTQIKNGEDLKTLLDKGKKLLNLIKFAPIPVMAVIKGSCLGAGLEIALSCHFRWASTNSMIGFPESENQILPGLGGTIEAQKIIKRSDLIELILTGKIIGAPEAEEIGLIDKTARSAELDEHALKYIESLTNDRKPDLIHKVMKSIHNGSLLNKEKALEAESLFFYEAAKTLYYK